MMFRIFFQSDESICPARAYHEQGHFSPPYKREEAPFDLLYDR